MTFAAKETSQAEGVPVELFYFEYGTATDAFYAFTDAEYDVTHQGITYRAVPIERDNYKTNGNLDKTTMRIRTDRESELFKLFNLYPPSQPVIATIRHGHLNDPDEEFLVIWTGRILGADREEDIAVYTCEPTARSMKRNGLRRNYQLVCPHALYGTACGADKGAATISVPIQSLTSTRLNFATGWTSETVSDYVGGVVEWGGIYGREYRTILRTDNLEQIVLNGPTTGLAIGAFVEVSLGCKHNLTDCGTIHNNSQNFGGQPWIPLRSPIRKNPFS